MGRSKEKEKETGGGVSKMGESGRRAEEFGRLRGKEDCGPGKEKSGPRRGEVGLEREGGLEGGSG